MKETYSTKEVAKMVGVHRLTIQRWLSGGQVRASVAVPFGGRTLWRWTEADVEKVRRFKGTQKPGRKPKKRR